MDAERLAAVSLFATLPENELAAVAAVAGELEVPEGDRLTVEGEFGHCLYAIEAGTADVVSNGTAIGVLGPGDVVGEIAVLASGRRTATIVASSPMRLISLFKRDVWALERTAPEAARRLREPLASHTAAPSASTD
jgi:CRP-like cAMP-binding protein